ncbi:response regulator [Lichenicoccus roseus]|uniref:Response regulator n=1 Tax=Lichenicoccus roseus TaxID=2683649 RepID=A0A5R9J1G2_9PROT|nr:response regulator [Lichenicoccus roseus]TLU71474.1 response regulator [Lichenicoccus roseus]
MAVPMFVLIVEDEPFIQDLMAEVLIDNGYRIAAASDGIEAMSFLDHEGSRYDVMITDVVLPGLLSGWEVAARARWINPTLPIIHMTGGEPGAWNARGVPGSVMLAKPFTLTQLVQAVVQVTKVLSLSLYC